MLNGALPRSNKVEKRGGMGDEERRGERRRSVKVRGKWKGRKERGKERREKGNTTFEFSNGTTIFTLTFLISLLFFQWEFLL